MSGVVKPLISAEVPDRRGPGINPDSSFAKIDPGVPLALYKLLGENI